MLIFDGDCGFCTSCATWIEARWQIEARAVPWQKLSSEELAANSLTLDDVRSAVWWIDATGERSRAQRAIARALTACRGWPSSAGRLLLVPPASWLAAAFYPLVARWRHRLPGGTPACKM
jgi:predicted DCC family thiol-disulfide oxidoreductase YuxK